MHSLKCTHWEKKYSTNVAICHSPSALRRPPAQPFITHHPCSTVLLPQYCRVDWSLRCSRVSPVRQPVNQISNPHTNPERDGADNPGVITSIRPRFSTSTPELKPSPPVTLTLCMASHYFYINIKFPSISPFFTPPPSSNGIDLVCMVRQTESSI